MPAKVDRSALIGKRIGRWTVLGEIKAHRWKSDRQAWTPQWRLACRCECGTLGSVPPGDLIRGHSTSCGCYAAEATGERRTTHGHTKGRMLSSEFISWRCMRQRCLDPNDVGFKRYGGAGVTIYEPWISSFELFLDHIGPMPRPGMTVDRINRGLGYEPGNIRWATRKQQARNRKTNLLVDFEDRIMSAAEAAELSGLSANTISQRKYYSWPASDLLKPLGFRRVRRSRI